MNALQQELLTAITAQGGNSPLMSIDSALKQLFTPVSEETRLQKARRAMGSCVNSVPDEDLEAYLTEFQYLVDKWLDEYECSVFDGLTLRQVLGQG
jgi:hypothetical protein